MEAITIIKSLVAYNADFDQRIWQSIEGLSDEQFCADYPYSHGSLRNHLVHVASVERGWLTGLQTGQRPPHLDPAEYTTISSVREVFNDIRGQVTSYVEQLNDAQLAEVLPGINLARWQVLLQITNHATDHRAQILRILHDYGQKTFDQDIVQHFWGR
ncbi:DinB family protein [Herpetosiphon llansteffanensis]|uniref:DinB family protein n=1 Tax=Herpetosiphon llansteffanensis TaxID=2094568 RepID=UPI000D7CB097|nr:DinB family protein [Herpetosiphon llansteffanensis]